MNAAYDTIARMHQFVEQGRGKFPYTARVGNWSFALDGKYILHIIYHGTEVVTADFKNKVVTNVTTGGWGSVSTKQGITRTLSALKQLGYDVPEAVDYEYKGEVRSNPWKDRVRTVYSSLEELRAYDRTYGIAGRLGYRSATELWDDNPVIGGSVHPEDLRVMRQGERLPRHGTHLLPARGNPEDDYPEKAEPDEEDIVINDSEREAFYAGKLIAETSEVDWDGLSRQIVNWMDKNKYWPDIWRQDDHGGWNLVTKDVHECAKHRAHRPARSERMGEIRNKLRQTVRSNTGEPDQDYDHGFFDEIVRQLAKAGFKDATHRQFDLYQGVYLSVPAIDTFWITDSYFTGEPQRGQGEKWKSAQLTDPEGSEVSSNRGDYFMDPKSTVLKGYLLRLQSFNGKWTEIEDPAIGELPDLLEVQRSFSFKKGTRIEVTIFRGEKTGKTAGVTSTEDGAVDASELVDLCKNARRTRKL